MRKLVGLAAAGLLAVSTANAGNINVANTDMVLYGGVSTGWSYQSNDHNAGGAAFDKDGFSVNTFAVGLTKAATAESPLGFNAAIAAFDVPTVIASSRIANGLVAHGDTNGSFKWWLAYASWMATKNVVIDAGLLWDNFGERPLTILNPNISRGILFTGHPVAFAGARATVDTGVAKVYVGYNNGGGLLQSSAFYNVHDAIEAGIMGQAGDIKFGLHTYNEANGRDIYVLCLKGEVGNTMIGLEADYTKLDDQAAGLDDSAWGVALTANPNMGEIAIPIRIEYVDNGNSGIYLTGDDNTWSFTITPTYKPSANTFIRAEITYVTADNNIFQDRYSTDTDDTRTTGAVEFGFLF